MYFIFPPDLTSASALPGETGSLEIAAFHLNAACFSTKTRSTVKNIIWSELNHHSLSKRSTGCNRQDLEREHSILLSVTHMLCVSQLCHGVSHCVKGRSCFRQAWSKSQRTVLIGYLTISRNVRRYQTLQMTIFFFQEDSAQVHYVCNTIQLSEKCDFRIFVFPHFDRYRVVQKRKLFQVA